MNRLKKYYSSFSEVIDGKEKEEYSYLTIFPRNNNISFGNENREDNFSSLGKQKNFLEFILDELEEPKYKNYYTLLVELYKYSFLYSLSLKSNITSYIKDVSISNTLMDENYNYSYKNQEKGEQVEITELLLSSITKDLFATHNNQGNENILYSIYLRCDIILMILKTQNIDVGKYINKQPKKLRELLLLRLKTSYETKDFKELLFESTGERFEMVSTSDHVFSSPPLRLIDSYDKMKDKDMYVFLYDINLWNTDKFRREFILDSTFYMENDNDLFIYPRENYPYASKPNVKHLKAQRERLSYVLEKIGKTKQESEKILNRFDDVSSILQNNISQGLNGSNFYKEYIVNLLSLFGLSELSEFVSNKMESFYESNFIQKFLPVAINETFYSPMCIKGIIETSDFFSGPMFYDAENGKITNNFYDSGFFLENLDFIYDGLKKGNILPSSKLIVWGLALCDIKHFGNDYATFEKLSGILEENGYKNDIDKLQSTKPKRDGRDFVSFNNETFSYSLRGDKNKLYRNTTKASRSTNIVSVYIHLGKNILDYWNKYKATGETIPIDFDNTL